MVYLNYGDDGRGLNEEESRQIFDQFYTTRRDEGGSGLGMNIVMKLVTEKLNGTIEITPPATGGTGFSICFPKKVGDENG